jgi:polyhydroxyalkanoate synthesis regulator phasin
MSSEDFTQDLSQMVQKGFRVTLGAASTLIEAIQDPQAQSQKYSEIGTDFNRLSADLAEKGEVTEREARRFVDDLAAQLPEPFSRFTNPPASDRTVTAIAMPIVDITVQSDLQALTEELTQIRQEIEQLRQAES